MFFLETGLSEPCWDQARLSSLFSVQRLVCNIQVRARDKVLETFERLQSRDALVLVQRGVSVLSGAGLGGHDNPAFRMTS